MVRAWVIQSCQAKDRCAVSLGDVFTDAALRVGGHLRPQGSAIGRGHSSDPNIAGNDFPNFQVNMLALPRSGWTCKVKQEKMQNKSKRACYG